MRTEVVTGGALAVGVAEDPSAVALCSGLGVGNVSLTVGDGDAVGARTRTLGLAGLTLDDAVFMSQVHGGEVARVSRSDAGRGARQHHDAVAGVDALVTHDVDLAVVVLSADCVPVLLVDPGRAVGAVHAGRRGIVAGVVGAAVAALESPDERRVTAVLGPAIGGCCYEVDESMAEQFGSRARTRWGTAALDLPSMVAAQLAEAGVGDVRRVGGCTRCDGNRWFSHRRQPGQGRQASLVARRSGQGALDGERPKACLDWRA